MNKWRTGWIAAGGLLAVGLGAWGLRALRAHGWDAEALRAQLRRPALQLQRVDFVGTRALEPERLWRSAGIAPGLALVDLDPRSVEAALASHPRIAKVRATRLPPGRLVIGIDERQPVALDAVSLEGIDAEGVRFGVGEAERAGLPLVRGDTERALEALAAARDLGIALASIDAQPSGGVDVEPSGAGVRLRLGADPGRDLTSWLALRASGLLARHEAHEIDLRFEGSAVLRQIHTKEETDGTAR